MKREKFAKKTMLTITAAATLFTSSSFGFTSNKVLADVNSQGLNLKSKAAIAVDADTGQIIYGKNENEPLPVASMSKLLSIYIILDAIQSGKLNWHQKVKVSPELAKMSHNRDLANVPLATNFHYTVRSLYQATLIYSANDAVMALAQEVAGSQAKFVDMMRETAKKLGINDAKIYTCNGLTNGQLEKYHAGYPGAAADDVNEFSARDMAVLASRLLKDHPEILKTTSIAKAKFNNGTDKTQMENWNWMLKGLSQADKTLPVDGLKTGTSNRAHACFTGTVNKDHHRLITVVMGAPHKSITDVSRFTETKKLMHYVYNNYDYQVIDKDTHLKGANVKVYQGKTPTAPVITGSETHLWVKKGEDFKPVTSVKPKPALRKDGELKAPVDAHDKVGELVIGAAHQQNANIYGEKGVEVTALAQNKIKRQNIFVRLFNSIKNII